MKEREEYFEKCGVSVCLFYFYVSVLNKWRRLRILRSVFLFVKFFHNCTELTMKMKLFEFEL